MAFKTREESTAEDEAIEEFFEDVSEQEPTDPYLRATGSSDILTREEIDALLEVIDEEETKTDIDKLLKQRNKEYKIPFNTNATTLGSIIKGVVNNYPNIEPCALGSMIYMQIKLLRYAGNPDHIDTRDDILGYATLIRDLP